MAQSLNSTVDYTSAATSYHGLATYGNVMVGNAAFEFYNERNPEDYIQIPWSEIKYVAASVMFKGKTIPRFAIFTTAGDTPFSFSTRDNKAVLRAMRTYLGDEKLLRSLSFVDVLKGGIKGLLGRKK